MPKGGGLYTNIETEFIRGHRWISLKPEVRCLYLTIWCYALEQKRQIIERPPTEFLRSMAGLPNKPIKYYLQILHEKRLIILLDSDRVEVKLTQSQSKVDPKLKQSCTKVDPNFKKVKFMFVPGLEKKNSKIKFKDSLEIPQGLLELPTFPSFPSPSLPKPPNPHRGKSANADGDQSQVILKADADAQAKLIAQEYIDATGQNGNAKKGTEYISRRLRGKKVGNTKAEVYSFDDLLLWTRNAIKDYNAREIVYGEEEATGLSIHLSNLFGQDWRISEFMSGPRMTMEQAREKVKRNEAKNAGSFNAEVVGTFDAIRERVNEALEIKPDLLKSLEWFTGPIGLSDKLGAVAVRFPWADYKDLSNAGFRNEAWNWMKSNG